MVHDIFFRHKKEKTRKKTIKQNKYIDNFSMMAAILMPFTTIPQIYKIWFTQNTAGVSIWTWTLYTLLCIPMLTYGIFYKMKPIIILNALWMIMNIIMIIGLIMY